MEDHKKVNSRNALIVILFLIILGLVGFIVYDKLIAKDTRKVKEPTKSVTKEETSVEPKENLDEIAVILMSKLDKYYVDYYDSKENVDFATLSDDVKMHGAEIYAYYGFNTHINKSLVDDYYNNLFGITLNNYPDLNCHFGDGVLSKYNSSIGEYEWLPHAHGGNIINKSILMKYNDIEKSGDNYIITINKLFAPYNGMGEWTPENAFYADHSYTVKLDDLSQFTRVESSGNWVSDLNGVKNYYEQNYEQFKNIKPQYKYTFSKNNNDYYLKNYQIIK